MDQYADLPSLLGENISPSLLQDIVNRLQLSGNIESESNHGINSVYGNARVGYGFPIDNDMLSLGLLGSGYKVSGSTPYGNIKQSDIGITGLDAVYDKGLSTYGVSYDRNPMMGNIWNIFYNRRF